MSYGKRYILQQALRDESKLIANIYEDGYSGSIYSYEAISITLSPNSNSDEPEAGIISSQLNISFLMSTQTDFNNFPDLLNYNDKKYYVELTRTPLSGSESVVWRGYMFNDYVNVPFNTATTQVDIVCIDALSFMKYVDFVYPDNINSVFKLLTIILGGLNSLGFPTLGNLYACCSYFGSSMNNRGAGAQYEPFAQSYVYKRDLVGKNYYDLIDQIMQSFNCRLFQYNGDWWIMAANEMAASTIYYTLYDASSNAVIGSGTLSNSVTIAPYSAGNLHFISNNQNKITRKGYPVLKVSTDVNFADDYIHNSSFKQGTSTTTTAWYASASSSGGGYVQLYRYPTEQFDVWAIHAGFSGATLEYDDGPYLPWLYGPGVNISFDAIVSPQSASNLGVIIKVNNYVDPPFYLQPDGSWSFTPYGTVGIPVGYDQTNGQWQSFSRDAMLGSIAIAGTTYNINGKMSITFKTFSGTAFIRNPRVTQKSPSAASLLVTRTITSSNSVAKEITSFLGIYRSDIGNCYGQIFNSTGVPITNWYRYGHSGDSFSALPMLIAREYSNLLNKNYATLEGDLGKTLDSDGLIYLNRTYTVSDSSTGALSYYGKKFIANRLTVNPYIDQSNSLQLLEVTDTDNASSETVTWITSA